MALIFDIAFQTDASNLQGQLGKIRQEIANSFKVPVGQGLSTELAVATTNARALEKALMRATTDKGVSYMSLNAELRKAGVTASQLTTNLALGGDKFRNSLNAANAALALSDRRVLSISTKMKAFGQTYINAFKYSTANMVFQSIAEGLRSAVQWTKELEKSVNYIGVVTGKTGNALEKVTQNAIKSAKELKVAAKDYADAAFIFYQQGLNDSEVQKRSEITIKAAKAAGQSVEQMSQQLTAVWNTYQMTGEEQGRAASVGAKLAATTASEFKDITEAMQLSAVAASQMGVSYDSLAAIIATVKDTTQQSASVIGNAFKTIFSRFEQLKAEGTDGEVTLNTVSANLEKLGIHVLDSAGNLRNLQEVITEVGNSWDQYSNKQQLAIAEQVGGTRQYSQFLALMQNWDKYQQNLQTAQGETGTATLEQQYGQYLDSIEARGEVLSETMKKIFTNFIDEDAIKSVYEILTNIGEVLTGMVTAIGGIPGILSIVGAALSSKILPMLIQGAGTIKDTFVLMTPGGRQRQINRQYDTNQKSYEAAYARTNDEEDKANLRVQMKLNSFNKQIALENEKILGLTKSTTGEIKIQAELDKERAASAQRIYAANIDNLVGLKQQVKSAQEVAEAEQRRQATVDLIAASEAKNTQQEVAEAERQAAEKERLAQERLDQAKNQVNAYNSGKGDFLAAATADKNLPRYEQELAEAQAEHLAVKERLTEATLKAQAAEEKYRQTASGGNVYQQQNASILKVTDALAKLGREQILFDKNGQRSAESAQTLGTAVGNLGDFITKGTSAMATLGQVDQETANKGQDLLNQLRPLSEELGNTTDETSQYEALKKIALVLNEYVLIVPEVDEATKQMAQAFAEAVVGQEDAQRRMADIQKQELAKATTQVNNMGTALIGFTMNINMTVNAIKSFVSAWTKAEGPLEKTGAILTLVAMGLPGIMGALKGFGGLIAGCRALGVELKGIQEGTLAAGKASGLAGAIASLGWGPFLLIVLAIAAAIAAIIIVIAQFQKYFNEISATKNVKRLSEAIDQLKTNLDNAKEKADSLRESFNKYSEAQEQLKHCVKGTEEFTEALQKANDAAFELMQNLPKDADWTKYLEIDSSGNYKVNEEAYKELQKQADLAATNAQSALLLGQYNLQKGQLNLSAENLVKQNSQYGRGYISSGQKAAIVGMSLLIPGIGPLIGSAVGAYLADKQHYWNQVTENYLSNDVLLNMYMDLIKEQKYDELLDELHLDMDTTSEEFKDLITTIQELDAGAKSAAKNLELITKQQVIEVMGEDVEERSGAATLISAGATKYKKTRQQELTTEIKDQTEDEQKNWAKKYAEIVGIGAVQDVKVKGSGETLSFTITDASGKELDSIGLDTLVTTLAANETETWIQNYGSQIIEQIGDEENQKFVNYIMSDDWKELTFDEISTMWDDIAEEVIVYGDMAERIKTVDEAAGTALADRAWEFKDINAKNLYDTSFRFQRAQAYGITGLSYKANEFWNDMYSISKTISKEIDHKADNGAILVGGRNTYAEFFEETVKKVNFQEDLQKVMDILQSEDQSDWFYFDKVTEKLQAAGYEAAKVSDEMVRLGRVANNASFPFSQIQQSIEKIAELSKDMELGKVISLEDYQLLTQYNTELEKFFQILSDGSAVFVGDPLDYQQEAKQARFDSQAKLVQYAPDDETKIKVMSDWYNMAESSEDLNQIDEKLTELGESDENIKKFGFNAAQRIQNSQKFQGVDIKELDDLVKKLRQTEKFARADQEALEDLATTMIRMDNAVSTIADSFEDWSKILNNNDQNSRTYLNTLGEMKETLAQALGIDERYFSDDFVIENLSAFEQIANGSYEVFGELREKLATNIIDNTIDQDFDPFGNIKNSLVRMQEWLLNHPLEMGTVAKEDANEEFLKRAQNMIDTAKWTAEEATDYFNSIGYEPVFKTDWQDVKTSIPQYVTEEYVTAGTVLDDETNSTIPTVQKHSRTYIEKYVDVTQPMEVPIIGPDGNLQLEELRASKPTPSMISKPTKKGGNSGSKPKTQKRQKKQEDVEKKRYLNLTNAIEGVSRSIKKLEDIEEETFGAKRINALEQKNLQLEKEGKMYANLYRQALKFKELDADQLNKDVYSKLGFNALFDADGVLLNERQIQDALQSIEQGMVDTINQLTDDVLNPAIDAYNDAVGRGLTGDALDAYQEAIDSANDLIDPEKDKLSDFQEDVRGLIEKDVENYKDSLTQEAEAFSNAINSIKQRIKNSVESLKMQLELKLKISDRTLSNLEFLLDKISSQIEDLPDKIYYISEKIREYEYQAGARKAQSQNILNLLTEIQGGAHLSDQELEEAKKLLTQDQKDAISSMSNEEAYEYVVNYFNSQAGASATIMNYFEENIESMEQIRDNLYEAVVTLFDSLIDAFDDGLDKLDKATKQYTGQGNQLGLLRTVFEATGQNNVFDEMSNQSELNLAAAEADIALGELIGAKVQQQYANDALYMWNTQLEEFDKNHNGVLNALEKEERNKLQEMVNHAQESFEETSELVVDKFSSAAEAVKALFETTKAQAQRRLALTLSGQSNDTIVNSLSEIIDPYEFIKFMRDRYVNDFNGDATLESDKQYLLTKLERQIKTEMEDLNDPSRLAKWSKFLDDINEKRAEGVKMTQKDFDILNAEFELQKKYDEYENAKNAKNSMRLQRDASGNWNYVYSNSAADTLQLQQEIDDQLYNIRKLKEESLQEMEDGWLEAEMKYDEIIENIDQERYIRDEQYRADIDRTLAQEKAKIEFYQIEISKYCEELDIDFSDTVLGILTGTESIDIATETYASAFNDYQDTVSTAAQNALDSIDFWATKAGIDVNDLDRLIEEKAISINQSIGSMETEMSELEKQYISSLQDMSLDTTTYVDLMIRKWSELIEEIDRAAAALKAAEEGKTVAEINDAYNGAGRYELVRDYSETFFNYANSLGWNTKNKNDLSDLAYNDSKANQIAKEAFAAGKARGLYSQGVTFAEFLDQWLPNIVGMDKNKSHDEIYNKYNPIVGQVNYYMGEGYRNQDAIFEAIRSEFPSSEFSDTEIKDIIRALFKNGGLASGGLVNGFTISSLGEEGPELVLNRMDTENILAAVGAMRDIALAQTGSLGGSISSAQVFGNNTTPVAQDVKIEASFPNVSVASEIEEALNNLVNEAVQYTTRK